MNYLIESNIALCVSGGLFFSLAMYSIVDNLNRLFNEPCDASVFTTPSVESANWHEPMFRVVENDEEFERRYQEAA